jgi:sodium transport system permease protein
MLSPLLVIARKEILDHSRDRRSVVSTALYALMGPIVVSLVSFSLPQAGPRNNPLPALMSVFALVAAFTGGMGVAMDILAGERERRSLLPLLLNPVSRRDVITGKWLAVAAFSAVGLVLNLTGFALTWRIAGMSRPANWPYLLSDVCAGLIPLTLLSSALELLISTNCRTTKEAQTWLSLAVFVPMLLGMGIVFYPHSIPLWWRFVPVAGQQLQLMLALQPAAPSLAQPLILGCTTIAATLFVVLAAGKRLHRDDVVYGGTGFSL